MNAMTGVCAEMHRGHLPCLET